MDQLHVTTHGGKMKGIPSVSSACTLNKHCISRSKKPCTICHYCYARTLAEFRVSMRAALEANHRMLNSGLLPKAALPVVNAAWARIESFGDVASLTHARNYLRLCRANPQTIFAAWTKNLGYWQTAIKLDGKPKNLVLVYSSPFVGVTAKVPLAAQRIVDHVFTVLPKDTPDAEINCGARSCLTCRKCYQRGGVFHITERLK